MAFRIVAGTEVESSCQIDFYSRLHRSPGLEPGFAFSSPGQPLQIGLGLSTSSAAPSHNLEVFPKYPWAAIAPHYEWDPPLAQHPHLAFRLLVGGQLNQLSLGHNQI